MITLVFLHAGANNTATHTSFEGLKHHFQTLKPAWLASVHVTALILLLQGLCRSEHHCFWPFKQETQPRSYCLLFLIKLRSERVGRKLQCIFLTRDVVWKAAFGSCHSCRFMPPNYFVLNFEGHETCSFQLFEVFPNVSTTLRH